MADEKGRGPGGPKGSYEHDRVQPPASILDIPRFLKELLGGFFSRFFYIFKLVWETGPWITFVMLLISVFNGVMPVIGAFLTKDILNEFQQMITKPSSQSIRESTVQSTVDAGGFWSSRILILLVSLFTYKILSTIINRINTATTRIAGEKVVNHVKIKIMNKAKEVDIASFDRPEFYERLENANREAGNRPLMILSSTFTMFSTIIGFVSYVIILSAAFPMAAGMIVVVSVPSAIINFIYRKKNFNYIRRRSKARRQMSYYSDMMVNKDLVKEIRMFKLSDTFIGRYRDVFRQYFAGLRKMIIEEGVWLVIVSLISSAVNCALYILIAKGVFDGEYMIGDYSLYTSTITSISTSVTSLITTSAGIYEGTLFIDNLISFMKEKKTVIPRISEPVHVRHGEVHTIEFIKVSFQYPGTERYVIRDVSFKLNPGETAVLVGLNGAGKTTLIKLLTRLYDPSEGTILLDGVDIKDYDVEDLYRMFGIIFQDFGKYAVSVNENIEFGDIDQEPTKERVRNAAVQANADDYIRKLPEGYDTPLMRIFEKEGLELSIGQWQKLAVARAFYGESDVLILDEPTASLDAIAEQEIFHQFDKLRQDKMTIFVSHRLSSATAASKILVLEEGRLIEEGTHKELMALQGKYYELFSTQAKRYIAVNE